MKKSRLVALLLAAMMALSLFAACGNDAPPAAEDPTTPAPTTPGATTPAPTEPAKAEKVFRTYMKGDASMINAHDDTETYVETVLKYCSSTLWRAVPNEIGNNFLYIPDLASNMPALVKTEENVTYTKYVATPQDDGTTLYLPEDATSTMTTWEFQIRDDAVWHNGEPLTAEDLIYSWKMLIDPVMTNKMANFLYTNSVTIYNGEKYYRGECEWEDVGIKLLDDGKTMQVICVGTPDEKTFCTHFNSRVFYPVYEEFYEAGMTAAKDATTYGENKDAFMGCGPYFLTDWEQGNKHVFTKNPDHWLADLYHFDEVHVNIVKDMNTRVQMFESGKLTTLTPDATVIVASVRALMTHGGGNIKDESTMTPEALVKGFCNLDKHVKNMQSYGVPVVVAINRFHNDTEECLDLIRKHCDEIGVKVAMSDVFAKGGEGGIELANTVVEVLETTTPNYKPLYDLESSVEDKITAIATNIYGADGVVFSAKAKKAIADINENGLGNLPICIAKTQASISDNPKLKGAPTGWELTVREIYVSGGAGFIVPVCGDMMLMPGLGKVPAAMGIDMDSDGKIVGLK